MTFAQALAWIEAALGETKMTRDSSSLGNMIRDELEEHAHSIVQLGKVAQEMRSELAYDTEDLGKTLTNGMLAYDRLMNGDNK